MIAVRTQISIFFPRKVGDFLKFLEKLLKFQTKLDQVAGIMPNT